METVQKVVNMGKVLKVREVGDPVLEKTSEEININNINKYNLREK